MQYRYSIWREENGWRRREEVRQWCRQGGRGGSFPLWVDVQKLRNMCVLSLSWNFFVSHDKYIARPSSKEPRWYTDNRTGTGGLRTLDPLQTHTSLLPVLQNPGGATQVRGWGEKEKKKSVREMGWDGIWTREGAIKAYTMSNVTSNFVFLYTQMLTWHIQCWPRLLQLHLSWDWTVGCHVVQDVMDKTTNQQRWRKPQTHQQQRTTTIDDNNSTDDDNDDQMYYICGSQMSVIKMFTRGPIYKIYYDNLTIILR